jgi:hypothetical protein
MNTFYSRANQGGWGDWLVSLAIHGIIAIFFIFTVGRLPSPGPTLAHGKPDAEAESNRATAPDDGPAATEPNAVPGESAEYPAASEPQPIDGETPTEMAAGTPPENGEPQPPLDGQGEGEGANPPAKSEPGAGDPGHTPAEMAKGEGQEGGITQSASSSEDADATQPLEITSEKVATSMTGAIANAELAHAIPQDLPADLRQSLEAAIQAAIQNQLQGHGGANGMMGNPASGGGDAGAGTGTAMDPTTLQRLSLEEVIEKIEGEIKTELNEQVATSYAGKIASGAFKKMETGVRDDFRKALPHALDEGAQSLAEGNEAIVPGLKGQIANEVKGELGPSITEETKASFIENAAPALAERAAESIRNAVAKRGVPAENLLDPNLAGAMAKTMESTVAGKSTKSDSLFDGARPFSSAAKKLGPPSEATKAKASEVGSSLKTQAQASIATQAGKASSEESTIPGVQISKSLEAKLDAYRRLQAAASNLAAGRGVTGDGPGTAASVLGLIGSGPGVAGSGPGVASSGSAGVSFQHVPEQMEGNAGTGAYFDEATYNLIMQKLSGRSLDQTAPQLGRVAEELEGRASARIRSHYLPVAAVLNLSEAPPSNDPLLPPLADGANAVLPPPFPTVAWTAARYGLQHPVVDGDLGDWKLDGPRAQLRIRADQTTLPEGPDVYIQWRGEGLYFAYDLKDATGLQISQGAPYHGDCLEIFLDSANSRVRSREDSDTYHQYFCMPFGYKGDPTNSFLRAFGKVPVPKGHSIEELNRLRTISFFTAKPKAEGYSVEGFISVTAILRRLIPGMYLGLDLSVSPDFNFAHQIQWATAKSVGNWRRPDTWGDLLLLGTDATLRFIQSGTDDAERTIIGINESAAVEVNDPDMNVDHLTRDTVAVRLASSDPSSTQVLLLTETGADTGIFRGSFAAQGLGLQPRSGLINTRSGDAIEATYIDSVLSNGDRNQRLTKQISVAWPVLLLTHQHP